MDITKHFKITIKNIPYFVYEGTCDGIPTKWVTKSEWNGKITLKMVNNELKYFDINGDEINVFDENDDEYNFIQS